MAFNLWSKCPHEAQTFMKIHGIEHGPPFSFGLCNVIASYITSNNYVYKEPRKMPMLLQPHFEASVRMRLTLPKVGTWSPSGLLQLQSSISGVKTPRLEVVFTILERS
jgi:hypothetical protein